MTITGSDGYCCWSCLEIGSEDPAGTAYFRNSGSVGVNGFWPMNAGLSFSDAVLTRRPVTRQTNPRVGPCRRATLTTMLAFAVVMAYAIPYGVRARTLHSS